MKHKTADELTNGDVFTMAGAVYRVLDTHDVSDDELIRITFFPVTNAHDVSRRANLTIERSQLFIVQ